MCWYVGKPFYAASVWDDSKPGIVSSGILAEVPNYDWGTYSTQEYIINPAGLVEDYLDFDVTSGTSKLKEYKETGSHVWSDSLGVDFSIKYSHFGIPIDIDTTVSGTEGVTNWVSYLVDRIGDTNPDLLTFRAYTPGGFRDILDPDPEKHFGGLKLHIWDMSGAG